MRFLRGDLEADGFSDPEGQSGYSAHDILSLGFKKSTAHAALLKDTKSIVNVTLDPYHAMGVTCLHRARLRSGRIVAIVCHGTCVLLKTRLSNDELLVKGKTWTGFANSEEQFADSFVGKKIQPFWIEEEASKIPHTNFVVAGRFKPFAVRDSNLITGQQQYSGAAAAKLVVDTLGR
jgi:putative intracellular protease/amidase